MKSVSSSAHNTRNRKGVVTGYSDWHHKITYLVHHSTVHLKIQKKKKQNRGDQCRNLISPFPDVDILTGSWVVFYSNICQVSHLFRKYFISCSVTTLSTHKNLLNLGLVSPQLLGCLLQCTESPNKRTGLAIGGLVEEAVLEISAQQKIIFRLVIFWTLKARQLFSSFSYDVGLWKEDPAETNLFFLNTFCSLNNPDLCAVGEVRFLRLKNRLRDLIYWKHIHSASNKSSVIKSAFSINIQTVLVATQDLPLQPLHMQPKSSLWRFTNIPTP